MSDIASRVEHLSETSIRFSMAKELSYRRARGERRVFMRFTEAPLVLLSVLSALCGEIGSW